MRDQLTEELRDYCDAHNLPAMSADELKAEVHAVLCFPDGMESAYVAPPGTPERLEELRQVFKWLGDYCDRWDAAKTCERDGHRDTGRGVCAICGAFLKIR